MHSANFRRIICLISILLLMPILLLHSMLPASAEAQVTRAGQVQSTQATKAAQGQGQSAQATKAAQGQGQSTQATKAGQVQGQSTQATKAGQAQGQATHPQSDPSPIDYETQVQTILNQRCAGCHNSNGLSGVRLVNYNAVMASQGSQYGRLIVEPGEPDQSPLYDKINPNPEKGNQMPSASNPLTAEQIETIRQWIDEGALPEPSPTSIATQQELPNRTQLGQNYPNPFNPATVIPYSLQSTARIQLSIFNIHGHHLQTLEAGTKPAGQHETPLTMAQYPSGLYLYRLDVRPLDGTPSTQQTRPMILVK